MFTVTVTYKDDTVMYYEVKHWRMHDKFLYLGYGKGNCEFVFNDKAISIRIDRNN